MSRNSEQIRFRKPIAFHDGLITQESLPYSFVHYPGFYGSFFAFASEETGPLRFCECARMPIMNYLLLRNRASIGENAERTRDFLLDSRDFPLRVVTELMSINPGMGIEAESYMRFETGICHRCNRAVPSLRYCHEMYGTAFIQNYGWYVRQQYFRLGIWPYGTQYLADICPQTLQADIEELKNEEDLFQRTFGNELEAFVGRVDSVALEERSRARRKLDQVRRKLTRRIENIVREDFGFRAVGQGWVNETLLYQIVKRVFPDKEILFHHRPEWLGGLELDVYVPDRQIAFEYQGIQHYHPIKAWGGETALENLRLRDAQKEALCNQAGVFLIKIRYTDPLTEEFVQSCMPSSQ